MSYITDDTNVYHVLIYVGFQAGGEKLCIDLAEESDDTEDKEGSDHYSCGPKRLSVDLNYLDEVSNPAPGDLVIGDLRDIKHSAGKDLYFGNNFLILGMI